jgi:hypothetical protein
MNFAARRFDHLGRRYEVMQKFSDQYWDAYLNLGDRTKVGGCVITPGRSITTCAKWLKSWRF